MTERSNKKKIPPVCRSPGAGCAAGRLRPGGRHRSGHSAAHSRADRRPHPNAGTRNEPSDREQGDYTNQRPVAVSIRTGDGSTPQWGIAAADVLIEGVTEGKTAGLTAVFASVDSVEKAGPVAPGRDLPLQLVLPLNAVPVHINKSVYASNLLNVLQYQDLDGLPCGHRRFCL